MKYILIDTNCWIDLLQEENEMNLRNLEHWVIQAKVILLIPEQLLKEWQKQKQGQIKRITKVQAEALPKLKHLKISLQLNKIMSGKRSQGSMNYSIRGKKLNLIKPRWLM